MTTKDELMTQVSNLLERLNEGSSKGFSFSSLLKHPIVVTTVTSMLVLFGTNEITKLYQLRDKQSVALAALESQMPKQLEMVNQLAMVSSVLEDQKCGQNNSKKKLDSPYVYGLTGKTCGEAEAEYASYFKAYLEEPPEPPLARMRAIFKSKAVDEGAKTLSILTDVLAKTKESYCIINVKDQADRAYAKLVDVALKEVDGVVTEDIPAEFKVSASLSKCTSTPVCDIPRVSDAPDMQARCKQKGGS